MIGKLQQYLCRLGQKGTLESVSVPAGLPLFITENTDWYMLVLNGETLLLATYTPVQPSPQDIMTVWETLCREGIASILILAPQDDAFCAVLDASGVHYIMPGARLSVPGKMVLVTKHVSAKRDVGGYLSLDAQLVVLWYLLKSVARRALFSEIRQGTMLDESHMSRAARELEQLGVVTIEKMWRASALCFTVSKAELWRKLQSRLRSPVFRKIRLKMPPAGLPTAGIDALATRSLLEPDAEPTFAVKRGDSRIDEALDTKYSGATIEIWRYEPTLFSETANTVDTLSLVLSLKTETDPRIRKELDLLLEQKQW